MARKPRRVEEAQADCRKILHEATTMGQGDGMTNVERLVNDLDTFSGDLPSGSQDQTTVEDAHAGMQRNVLTILSGGSPDESLTQQVARDTHEVCMKVQALS